MPDRGPRKLVIVGVGLIGGSFALALKRAGGVGRVIGVGRNQENLDTACRLGIVDRGYRLDQRWTDELADADLVLVATPVGQMPSLFAAIGPILGADTVLTDAGSTKQDVVAAARAQLGAGLPRFVPGHPIAGSERSGAQAASADLFKRRSVVLTPLAETDRAALARVEAGWRRCGAVVRQLDPARHDAIMAAVSHLPHALAYAFVAGLAGRAGGAELLDYAATGFRDFTRLASSHPAMWRDLLLANREAVRGELSRYRRELEQLEALLERGDGEGLLALLEQARNARAAWLERAEGLDRD